jgi:hypothetical protein
MINALCNPMLALRLEAEQIFAEAARKQQATRTDLVANLPRSEPRKARDEAARACPCCGARLVTTPG